MLEKICPPIPPEFWEDEGVQRSYRDRLNGLFQEHLPEAKALLPGLSAMKEPEARVKVFSKPGAQVIEGKVWTGSNPRFLVVVDKADPPVKSDGFTGGSAFTVFLA